MFLILMLLAFLSARLLAWTIRQLKRESAEQRSFGGELQSPAANGICKGLIIHS